MISSKGNSLKKFVNELNKRRVGFEKNVLKALNEEALKQIKKNIPNDPMLGNYGNHLRSAEVTAKNPMTGVLYTGPTMVNAKHIDPATTLIFVRGVKKDNKQKAEILLALELYQPYTLKTFPSNIHLKDFLLTYQKVPEKKVNETIETNIGALKAMTESFKKAGIKINPEQYEDPKRMDVFPDLTFQVLQHELKTKKKAKPHWKPALKMVQNKSFVKKIMADDSNVRILTDPNYKQFKNSGKMGLKVSEQSVQSTADFIEYIKPTSKE